MSGAQQTPMACALAVLRGLPHDSRAAVVRDGRTAIVTCAPSKAIRGTAHEVFSALSRVECEPGFWTAMIGYDVGRAVEQVPVEAVADRTIPDFALARYDARLVIDPGMPPRLVGSGEGRRLLRDALRRAARDEIEVAPQPLGVLGSSLSPAEHADRVGAIHELLRAGECYQVNLTRRLHTPVRADARRLFAALAAANPAPHEGLYEFADVALASSSPELFLRIDTDRVSTRPIKGTSVDRATLAASGKDRAEHVMIVDLARNDLGRVARAGSVSVDNLCAIESHPGLHHMVSTVRARLRPECGVPELVRACFPPASVTGAPKPRVLRAIEHLEPVRRGPYCGALGWFDVTNRGLRAELAVAIRTFVISDDGTDLGVGGGIVIDSDAAAEWRETELKAATLLRAAGGVDGASLLVGTRS